MDAVVRAVLTVVADPLWIVDRRHVLTEFNTPFIHLCDKALHVVPSAPIELDRLLDPHRHAKANAWWRDLASRVFEGRNVSADVRVVIDGLEKYFSISGTPVVCEDAIERAVFTARDVTGAGRAERDDLLELAVTRIFAIEKPLDDTLGEVLEFVCESDGWDCGVMWLLDSGEKQVEPRAFWTRPNVDTSKFRERLAATRFGRGRGVPGKAWAREEIVWVADLFDESGYVRADVAAHAGLHGAVAVPLFDSDRFVGVLEMLTRAVRPMSEQRHRALFRAGKSLGRLIVRRQLQDVVERKGQEWSLTFDAIELPIFITRLDGTIVRVNRAARDLVGGEFHDVLGRNIAIDDTEEPWKTLSDIVAAVRDSHTPCTAQISQGLRHWDVSATSYASDEEERAIVMMRDTTDLVLLEESVHRGEQMAALGELVAGVAHEVRNPIFGIGLTVDTLQQMLPQSPDFDELVTVLRSWLARLNRLMENLLAYGKSWTLVLERGDLENVLIPVVEGCRQIASQFNVSVVAEVEPGLEMLMDANRLGHAFENLIVNAIQHSRPQQSVLVTARNIREDGREVIECAVRDHGPGFNPVELPRVFQPFFTKRRGGTGLGLSIVQRVVDEHGGTIAAGNATDGGALLTLRFPVYRGEAAG